MHGTLEANNAMHNADVVLAIGARFDDRVTNTISKFCPYAEFIHVDIDPASISKNVVVDVPIVGPVQAVLEEMVETLKAMPQPSAEVAAAREDWWAQIEGWRDQQCLAVDSVKGVIKPQEAVKALYEVTKGQSIITSDVGQHQMFAAFYYPYAKPRQWINSGGSEPWDLVCPLLWARLWGFPMRQLCVSRAKAVFR